MTYRSNIITQNKARRIISYKLFTNNESLSKAIR